MRIKCGSKLKIIQCTELEADFELYYSTYTVQYKKHESTDGGCSALASYSGLISRSGAGQWTLSTHPLPDILVSARNPTHPLLVRDIPSRNLPSLPSHASRAFAPAVGRRRRATHHLQRAEPPHRRRALRSPVPSRVHALCRPQSSLGHPRRRIGLARDEDVETLLC